MDGGMEGGEGGGGRKEWLGIERGGKDGWTDVWIDR